MALVVAFSTFARPPPPKPRRRAGGHAELLRGRAVPRGWGGKVARGAVAVAHWRHRLSPSRNLSWGVGGGAPPLCPSANPGAQGKFSVLENHQEWGRGPARGLGPRNASEEPGRSSWNSKPARICFLKLDRGQSVPDSGAIRRALEKGAALASHSPAWPVARGPEQPPKPPQLREGLESDRHGLSRPEYK